jgi:hypothetical protein
MATLSRTKQLDRQERMGRSIHEIRRQRAALDAKFKREMRKMITVGYSIELNNADIARLIGGVTPEAVRLHAEAIGLVNPRKRRRGQSRPPTLGDPPPSDPS